MDITELTVHELQEKLKNSELTSYDITKAYTDKIQEKEKTIENLVQIKIYKNKGVYLWIIKILY